jgi:hypothetical protein
VKIAVVDPFPFLVAVASAIVILRTLQIPKVASQNLQCVTSYRPAFYFSSKLDCQIFLCTPRSWTNRCHHQQRQKAIDQASDQAVRISLIFIHDSIWYLRRDSTK